MKRLLALAFLVPCIALFAQEKDKDAAILAQLKQLESNLHYQKGEINLRGDLAKLTMPENFRYLGADDADVVLTKMWGNPAGNKTLGMILPADVSPLSRKCWAVVITYAEDGYVKDSDADKINYADLLKKMQKATAEASAGRKQQRLS
jgi:uncharacterized membrane-anchored protein